MSITFETKCWEQDWEILLKTDYLRNQIENCNYQFARRRLIINNVKDPDLVSYYANNAIKDGIIDEFVIAEEWAEIVLDFFNLSKESLGKGYYYSISELVGIYLASSDYLLHFSSDSRLEKKSRFVQDALFLLQNHSEVAVVNPMWNYKYSSIDCPNWDENHLFHIGNGFSDQCYLVRTSEFRKDIYHYSHQTGSFFPEYGGELFEKRCNAYLRCNDRKRATYMRASYWTENLRGLDDYKKREHSFRSILHRIKYHI